MNQEVQSQEKVLLDYALLFGFIIVGFLVGFALTQAIVTSVLGLTLWTPISVVVVNTGGLIGMCLAVWILFFEVSYGFSDFIGGGQD